MDISVILATFGRSAALSSLLDSLSRSKVEDLSYEVIVIDNEGSSETRSVVHSYRDRLPLLYLSETRRGKNRALLKGIEQATGSLLLFTDDDVLVPENWLMEIYRGSIRYPRASIFGGRILPRFPGVRHDWVAGLDFEHWFLRSAYVLADWDVEDGGRLAPDQVWGPNMAVRRRVFEAGISFNPELGPGTDQPLGDETDFVARAAEAGHTCLYLRDAVVHHCIREDQLTREWLGRRAFLMGRAHARGGASADVRMLLGVPRHLLREYLEKRATQILSWGAGPQVRLIRFLECEVTRGRIAHHRDLWGSHRDR